MFLMFSDDSGDARNTWRVFASICLSEMDAFELKNFISKIKAENGIDPSEELKPLNRDYHNQVLTEEKAEEITFAIYDYLASIPTLKIYSVFFNNSHLKEMFSNNHGGANHVEINNYCYCEACDCLYNKFDMLLAQDDYPKIEHEILTIPKFGMIIMDEPSSRISRTILDKMRRITAYGTRYRPSSLIFWGVTFTSSEKNFGIEAAGFVAFSMRKAINNDEITFVNRIKGKIYRTSEGFIDNYGATFFDGQSRQSLTRQSRRILLENSTGENFLELVYNEAIQEE